MDLVKIVCKLSVHVFFFFFWERELSVNLDALYLNSTQKLDTKTETVWIDSYNINYHHGCILRV